MGDKSGLCLWCGRWANGAVALDGLADCDRADCIAKRNYKKDGDDFDEFDLAGGIKTIDDQGRVCLSDTERDR